MKKGYGLVGNVTMYGSLFFLVYFTGT